MIMKDLNWVYMLDVLSGAKFSNYGLQCLAELNIGNVKERKVYPLLTNRLYTPTVMEKFAAK
jgi:DNA polymerase/3'-5' exonuclease PolX